MPSALQRAGKTPAEGTDGGDLRQDWKIGRGVI